MDDEQAEGGAENAAWGAPEAVVMSWGPSGGPPLSTSLHAESYCLLQRVRHVTLLRQQPASAVLLQQ
ncbi:hypothetical protein ACSSS7_003156 [Eimeria intestinalis]